MPVSPPVKASHPGSGLFGAGGAEDRVDRTHPGPRGDAVTENDSSVPSRQKRLMGGIFRMKGPSRRG
jgi:hypothetical protein